MWLGATNGLWCYKNTIKIRLIMTAEYINNTCLKKIFLSGSTNTTATRSYKIQIHANKYRTTILTIIIMNSIKNEHSCWLRNTGQPQSTDTCKLQKSCDQIGTRGALFQPWIMGLLNNTGGECFELKRQQRTKCALSRSRFTFDFSARKTWNGEFILQRDSHRSTLRSTLRPSISNSAFFQHCVLGGYGLFCSDIGLGDLGRSDARICWISIAKGWVRVKI